MTSADLVSLADVQTAHPALTAEQLADAPSLITAASLHIGGLYPKARAAQAYDEEYEVGTNRAITLRQPRVLAVAQVAADCSPVLTITHTGGARRAGVEVQATGEAGSLASTGLILTATAAGIPAEPVILTWEEYPTVGLLADAINALAGWNAAPPADGDFATADLRAVQGTKSALRVGAQLWGYTRDLDDWQLKDGGTLVIPEWREEVYRYPDKLWGADARTSTVRVVYTAGWRTVPEDIKRACLILVKDTLDRTEKTGAMIEESSDDYSYKLAAQAGTSALPTAAKSILSRYRTRSIS